MNKYKIRRFNGGVWPPQSPDMNPIEHLWPMVAHELRDCVFSGKESLWSSLQEAFAAIRPEQIKALYKSLPKRMEAVVKAQEATPDTD